jgi:hypothetical protein
MSAPSRRTGRIDRAVVTPGHDGTAELYVEVSFDHGQRSALTFNAEVMARIVDREGIDSIAHLIGREWTVLVPDADALVGLTKGT